MVHEWIKVFGVDICYWCGVNKAANAGTECKSKVKVTTKSGKLTVTHREGQMMVYLMPQEVDADD